MFAVKTAMPHLGNWVLFYFPARSAFRAGEQQSFLRFAEFCLSPGSTFQGTLAGNGTALTCSQGFCWCLWNLKRSSRRIYVSDHGAALLFQGRV